MGGSGPGPTSWEPEAEVMTAHHGAASRVPPGALHSEGVLWTRLVALHSQVDNVVERALHRQFGLGLSEFLALVACAAAPDGEMRMQELTEAVYLNQSSVSRMVSRLERSRLTERRTCEFDRRGVYTGITEHGLQVLRDAVPVYEAALRDAFDRAQTDPNLAALVHALRSVQVLPAALDDRPGDVLV